MLRSRPRATFRNQDALLVQSVNCDILPPRVGLCPRVILFLQSQMNSDGQRVEYRQLLGISLTSMSTLTLEIVLTRVFSVTMRYHFAFLAVSLALLGSGIAGVTLHFFPSLTKPERARRWIGWGALALALSVPLTFILYLQIPFHPSRTSFPPEQILYLILICLNVTSPFFLSGLVLSLALSAWPRQAGRVYWADLMGAALGCLLGIALLEGFGGAGAVLVVAVVAALAGLVFAWKMGRRSVWAILAVMLLAGFALGNRLGSWITVSAGQAQETDLVYERWNAHSQVTVYDVSYYPFYWSVDMRYWNKVIQEGRFLNHSLLLIDGVAGTPIQEFRGLLHEVEFLRYDLSSLVYYVVDNPKTMVIGPGGGRDVLAALASGAPHVTAVEVNPAIVEAMRGPFAEFAGHIYERPDVTIAVDDARGYIARSSERYDVIQASLIDTWAAGGSGAFALSENSLYTVEAFQTYYDHLTDRGVLTISRWYLTERPAETMRLISTGMAGWRAAGAADPRQHVVVVARPNVQGQIEGMATVLFKRTPFTQDAITALVQQSEELGFTVLYAPGLPVHEEVGRFILADDFEAAIADYPLDISPAVDDRPFFFNLVRFGDLLDPSLSTSGVYRASMEALLILTVVLVVTTGMGVLFILVPLWLGTRRQNLARPPLRLLVYFGLLGAGFMLVEMPIIQRLAIYLGRPVYSLAVVLFSLLLFSGLGSLWSGRTIQEPARRLRYIFPLLLVLVMLHAVGGGRLLHATIGWTLPARLAVTVALLAPLGFLMGMPFPSGMRWAGTRYAGSVPWLWGINGVMSVLGSALSITLAIHFGLTATIVVAGVVYGLAWSVMVREVRRAA
jgi:spermidine synthase